MIQFSCQLHFSFSSFEIVTLFSARFLDMFLKRRVGPSSLTGRRAHGALLLHLREKEEYPYLKIPLLTQLPVVFDLEIFKFLVDCLELTQ